MIFPAHNSEISLRVRRQYRMRQSIKANDAEERRHKLFTEREDRVARGSADQGKAGKRENNADRQSLPMFRACAYATHVACSASSNHAGEITGTGISTLSVNAASSSQTKS